ncbi:zinc finger BED domain-containing protein 1-like [Gymnodraco acuticeps]|uniref:Zinc finger BED domain-containing protein 1-like n=1 Tax=Gymnodraco acuticeps TaxID=8218 RepID=A0A6P8UAG5_GYMAC|nr:zinc finger BED domain-containing protein 1-like [Gymnodraco acuticeps]
MTTALNPKYTPPSRDSLSNELIPAWYKVEKSNVVFELSGVSKVAITSDGWTSISQDHYLTVTAHYIIEGKMRQKVLRTKAIYTAQTGQVVAEEIGEILQEFGIMNKIAAVTVDNAANMDVAIKRLNFIKLGCFAHTLNLGAQSVYSLASVTKWTAKIRGVVVWMKRSSMGKTVLREKQQLLNLPKHSLILDVRTRWNSLYMMLERFIEQYPAIQAASLDQRLRKPMERDRLARLTEDDFRRAEEFIHLMKVLYTSTLCVSSEKSPTCGQILPILRKLEKHFSVEEGDTVLGSSLKQAVWGNLSKRYQTDGIRTFLEEATALDPRFKNHVEDSTVWDRIKEKVMVGKLTESEQPTEQDRGEEDGVTQQQSLTQRENEEEEDGEESEEEQEQPPPCSSKRAKMTPLEELFAAEDSLKIKNLSTSTMSTQLQTDRELKMYQDMPPTMTSDDPAAWWWNKRTTYPLLSEVALSYLCVQASSTPSERVFSTAGDTICPERSRILPEKADMLIFLNKNC